MATSVETTIFEGKRLIKEELDKILKKAGANLKIIQKHGALCLNVESGREIAGVAEYHPSRIVATEPDDKTQRAKDNLRTLAKLAPRFNASVRLQHDFTAMRELNEREQRFGLITNLNMFPEDIPYAETFLANAKEVTARDGLIVTSMAEKEYRPYFDSIKQRGIPGLKLDIIERENGVAGSVVLTAKKL